MLPNGPARRGLFDEAYRAYLADRDSAIPRRTTAEWHHLLELCTLGEQLIDEQ
jgi:hypothetical protein